jgi:tetratricopeptide (TPR) repeat protein
MSKTPDARRRSSVSGRRSLRITDHSLESSAERRVNPRITLFIAAATFVASALAGEAEWKLLQEQAEGHLQRGAFAQAEQFGRSALKETETLGPSHRGTEQSLSTLSLALRLQGKHADALPLAQRLVAIRTKQYGPDETSTGIALHNNAEILLAMGRYAEAEKLQAGALAAFEKKLGPVHQNTASAMHNMGAIQLKQGKHKEAEKYLRRALAAKEKALSPGNLSIAHTLESLAASLEGQGRQLEAEKFKKRAEGMRERAQAQKTGA